MGYVENFSATMGTATGDVVLLCDQDDVSRRDKIKVMAGRFERDPRLLLLHSDARLVDAAGADMGCTLFETLQLHARRDRLDPCGARIRGAGAAQLCHRCHHGVSTRTG